jgi:hypothetical protein
MRLPRVQRGARSVPPAGMQPALSGPGVAQGVTHGFVHGLESDEPVDANLIPIDCCDRSVRS